MTIKKKTVKKKPTREKPVKKKAVKKKSAKKKKSKAGRPNKYKAEYAEQARKYCLLGATDVQLAEMFEVVESTINKWKLDHPKFSESIKAGKSVADAEVAESLFHRAKGYSHPEDKIFNDNGKPLIVPTTKEYPPDPTSMIFWLKNRRKDDWRDKLDHEHTGKDGGPIQTKTTFIGIDSKD